MVSMWFVLVAPRRASKASLAKDLPFHFCRRMGAVGVLGLVPSLGLRVLSLALILALLLPLRACDGSVAGFLCVTGFTGDPAGEWIGGGAHKASA